MPRILPIIVLSQFLCTSLWFAGNAVLPDIIQQFGLAENFLANLTSIVQLGFIAGTLVFALMAIADRFLPSRLFFICSVVAAVCNLMMIIEGMNITGLLLCRFLTGFFLAGIYPVGMKIAADHFKEGLGKSLGLLVGALVLGTALPHLLRTFSFRLEWNYVIISTSVLSVTGGWCMLRFVPSGPYRKQGQRLSITVFSIIFREPKLRAAALGYFGHMWELYAFWAFVPVILKTYNSHYPAANIPVSLYAFIIIAVGSIACAIAGYLSQKWNTKKLALSALSMSGICCFLSPLLLLFPSVAVLMVFLVIWGLVVIADSPLFSTLVAQNAPPQIRGSVITLVTCMGFAITIGSLQCLGYLFNEHNSRFIYLLLGIGPVAGIVVLLTQKEKGH